MKTLKLSALVLLSILIVSTTGCVSVTSSPDVESSYYDDPNPVTSDSPYFHAVEVGKTEGFVGTNAFWISGRVSPNLTNESAKEVLEKTLSSSNMLAQNGQAQYQLDAIMVDDDAVGAFASETSLNGTTRDMSIRYILRSLKTTAELYNEVIVSHGEGTCDDACFAFYIQESYAAERSQVDSLRQLVADLKALPVD
ncbi:hypothetical protein [Salinicola sp. MIT1003]|uniref:hypothetical protein n=1 Tax=Salinicola sp. MIT1003 TaxID=1882734 RepID=UPI00091F239F|nr:hypothetical protein [Salinicola sp. MIT1003]OHZ03011.1 hypothetical protein BC443_15080 [Salinicola sp. MIT1003]